MQKLRILHISDLHINAEENFDRSVVLDPLIERVKKDKEAGVKPEIIIVSGDIASTGVKAEYELAKEFFDDLIKIIGIKDDRIFIVPGNHDVNRKKYRPTDIPSYGTMRQLNEELENPGFRSDLLKGMDDYFSFTETHYSHLRSIHERLVPFVNEIKVDEKKKIGIIGLNSAWMCRKSPDREEIAIGEYQVKAAMSRLDKMGKPDLIIFVFHHPLNWLWLEDRKINRSYFNDSILLCGHLHSSEGVYLEDLDGRIFQFQAGASYLGSDSNWPVSFQYISINMQNQNIQADFRKFYSGQRKWAIDGEKGDDGKKVFKMRPIGKMVPKELLVVEPEKPEKYIEWIISNYGNMDAEKLYGKGEAFPLSLPKIFVHLNAYDPESGKDKRREFEEKREPVDIEAIIARTDYLLIEGAPGSGKTTLLKHLTYCLAKNENNECKIESSETFLPILIPMKQLNDFFADSGNDKKREPDALDILAWYFINKLRGFLSIEIFKAFLKSKRAIILLDGLDELLPAYRDPVVNAFSDLMIKYHDNKLVITSRPHGIEGAVIKRFGDKHISILSLTMDQVNLFIHRWFTYLYPGSEGIGGKNAQAMIGEVKDHSSIRQLIVNPLMLTAICLLYHDEKELPGQRAELYKKFIDNMLYRRFQESEDVHNFLKTLASRMHKQKARGVDRSFTLKILEEIFKRHNEESVKDHMKRLVRMLEEIEPKCGLLKIEDGQHTFWHLTFQEFLTAQYLVDNSTNYSKAIKEYWSDNWYREVIELFIGYLSIDNKKWANTIIEDAIDNEDISPFNKWILASESLIDIHKSRRYPKIEDKTRKRMLNIIDSSPQPKYLVRAGEILGWLGDPRDLKIFISVEGGEYELENIGKVQIDPFEIGKYPITNSWFGEFVKAERYNKKEYWSKEGRKWQDHTKAEHPALWNDRKWKCPNSPVVGVSWYEADAFTRWLTLTLDDGYEYRLLTEKEWQAAAAGKSGRKYPWGDKWDKNKCNNGELKIEKTSPVGIFKLGDTPEGISDLSGNVWEWTISDYHSKDDLNDFVFDRKMYELLYEKGDVDKYLGKLDDKKSQLPVLRGGSWLNRTVYCRCASRFRFNPLFRYFSVGFRCARTLTL